MFSLPHLFSGGHPENILILLLLHTLVFACDLPYPVILVRVVDGDTAYMSVTI